jgi:thiopeptide-type bacteriocin biosynthesis protein
LFFASPEVERMLASLDDGALPDAKLVRALTRYFLRAAGRETPFGLFAGISLGHVGGDDCLEIGPASDYRRLTRVAPSVLCRLLNSLEPEPSLHYELSSTLALVHGSFRFTCPEPAATHDGRDVNSIVELTATPMLHRTVQHAGGSITADALSRSLLHGDLEYEDVLAFVLTLCKRSFLVPSCLPTATGEGMLEALIRRLKAYPVMTTVNARLQSVQQLLTETNHAALGNASEPLHRARAILSDVSDLKLLQQPLQSDLLKPAPDLRLSEAVARQFLAAAERLQRTGSVQPPSQLVEFRERFTQRYDQRWVPLLEVLDRDAGIGFEGLEGSPRDAFLKDIKLAPRLERQVTFDAYDQQRLKLWQRTLTRGETVCELDDEDLASFPTLQSGLPESFSVMARLAKTADGGLQVVAPIVAAPSALSTLARFAEADAQLGAALRRHAQQEQALAGDVLLADVAYLPHDASAHVAVRPVLRSYEIPLLGGSSAPLEQQIRLADLLVGVEGGSIALYDTQRSKRVKVRLASAHNFSSPACPVSYRFLGALQLQDEGNVVSSWSWGVLEDAEYLPRVVCRDSVLSLARFRLSSAELKPALAARGTQAFALVHALREQRRLPRFLTRPEGDQRLPVDLDNELSVEELLHAARQHSGLVLEELLPGPDQLVLRGQAGYYCAELVVPFLRGYAAAATVREPLPNAAMNARPSERRHAPGSRWLYAKIYAGRSRLDEILQQVRANVVQPLLGRSAELWFFLPYADPDPHLRLRFMGEAGELRRRVLPRLNQILAPLLERGVVWRVAFDTYEQELERYGGAAGMPLAERVFWADSEAAVQLQEICADDDDLRWQLAVLGVDRLLGDFGYDLPQRARFVASAGEAYALEAGADAATTRAIATKYRQFTPSLSELLWQPEAASPALQQAHASLNERSSKLRPLGFELRAVLGANGPGPLLDDLLRSFCHLHALRLLGLGGRSFELVLYDFLRRQYRSRAAKEKAKGGSLAALP